MDKSKPVKTKYSEEEIRSAILLLIANDRDFQKTANTVGVAVSTLRRWSKEREKGMLMHLRNSELPIEVEVLESEEVLDDSFMLLAKKVKVLALQRLNSILATANDVNKVTNAIDVLHKITGGDEEDDKGITNYFSYLEKQHKIQNGIKKSLNPDQGDQQE